MTLCSTKYLIGVWPKILCCSFPLRFTPLIISSPALSLFLTYRPGPCINTSLSCTHTHVNSPHFSPVCIWTDKSAVAPTYSLLREDEKVSDLKREEAEMCRYKSSGSARHLWSVEHLPATHEGHRGSQGQPCHHVPLVSIESWALFLVWSKRRRAFMHFDFKYRDAALASYNNKQLIGVMLRSKKSTKKCFSKICCSNNSKRGMLTENG